MLAILGIHHVVAFLKILRLSLEVSLICGVQTSIYAELMAMGAIIAIDIAHQNG
jgi:hypothetical protein